MALTQSVYDPEKDDTRPHPQAAETDDGNDSTSADTGTPDTKESLRDAEESGKGLYNKDGDAPADDKSAGDIKTDGKADDSQSGGFVKKSLGKDAASSKKNKLLFGFNRRRLLLFTAAGSTLGLLGILILLLIIASSLKIPNLAQNITTLEFARLSRQFAQNADRATAASLGEEALDKGAFAALKAKYANGKVAQTWGKLDGYRPSSVIQTLNEGHGLQMRFKGSQFVGASLNGVEYDVRSQGASRYVPVLNKLVAFNNEADFVQSFKPALQEALGVEKVGPIVRLGVARSLRREMGISLLAWVLADYKDKGGMAAREQVTKDKFAAIDEKAANQPATSEAINSAEQGADQAKQDAVNDPGKLQATIDNGGLPPGEVQAMDNALGNSAFKDVLGTINPIYAIATPVCIIYDGSMDKSGGTIDNNTRQQQAAFYYIESAADQQKNGSPSSDDSTELTAAVGALNDDLGDISKSNAYNQANGTPVDTSNTISAEASAGGEFTLFNAIPGMNDTLAGLINKSATPICQAMTNTYVGVGLGIASIIGAFFTGGTSAVGEKTVAEAGGLIVREAADTLAQRLLTNIADRFAIDTAADSIPNSAKILFGASRKTFLSKDTLDSTIKNAVGVAAGTVLAKLIVMNRANITNSGFNQGTDLANEAQAGGNIHAGEIERTQLFGAPMQQADVQQSDAADAKSIAASNASMGVIERYASIHNPTSLLSRVAISVSGQANLGIGKRLLQLGVGLLRPSSYGWLLRPFYGRAVAATSNAHYGNVQFGWTNAEENLIDSNESYLPLENQQILDNSGKEATIAQEYAPCFGYTADADGNLTLAVGPSQAGSLGTLLSSGDITRDANGNVLDTKLCAPSNLGPHNKIYRDLVFRWRLAQSYNTTFDQLTASQDISS